MTEAGRFYYTPFLPPSEVGTKPFTRVLIAERRAVRAIDTQKAVVHSIVPAMLRELPTAIINVERKV